MPQDTTIDDAINAAQEKLEAQSSESVESTKDDEVEIQGLEAETEEETAAPEKEASEQEEQISDKEANAETIEVEAGQTEQATQAPTVEAPAFLSAETKALWNKIPSDAQKALAQDALRTQQLLSRSANESQRGKAWEQRVNSTFETKEALDAHRAQLRLVGINDEVEELHRYRAWNTVLKSDPVSYVKGIIAEHGITPQDLEGEAFSEEQERYANDPRVDQVIEELKQEREARENEAKQIQAQKLASQVNAWKAGADKYGKPRAEFAAMYAPQIDAEWQQILQEAAEIGEQITLEDSLTRAHERVQDRVFKAHGINPNMPKSQSPEQKAAQVAKLKGAVTVASGAPRSDVITKKPRKEYRNDKERVAAAVARAEERISSNHR